MDGAERRLYAGLSELLLGRPSLIAETNDTNSEPEVNVVYIFMT